MSQFPSSALLLPAGFRAAAATAAAAGVPAACLCLVSAGCPGATGRGRHAALLRSAARQPAHHHEVIKTHQQTGKNLNCLFFFPWGGSKLIDIFDTSRRLRVIFVPLINHHPNPLKKSAYLALCLQPSLTPIKKKVPVKLASLVLLSLLECGRYRTFGKGLIVNLGTGLPAPLVRHR